MPLAEQTTKRGPFMVRYCRIEDADRSFDLKFWQAQSDAARFAAAWEMVVTAQLWKGRDPHELRFQRSVATLRRQSS